MKLKTLLLLFTFTAFAIKAQVNVGLASFMESNSFAGKLDDESIEQFKKTITIFVVSEKEKGKLEDYKKAITPIWSFNNIKFINESELPSYSQTDGAFSFVTLTYHVNDPQGFIGNAYFCLEYWLKYSNKNKERTKTIAHVTLYPDYTTERSLSALNGKEWEKQMKEGLKKAVFYNYTPALLKCYFSFISNSLTNKSTHWSMEESEVTDDKTLLNRLATDTLFIPDYVNIKPGIGSSGPEGEKELMADYKFNYKFLTPAEFDKKAVNSTKTTFVLAYALIQTNQKYFSIYDTMTGALVYSTFVVGGKVKAKDFEKLSGKIQKTQK